jgi:hypothetical protein
MSAESVGKKNAIHQALNKSARTITETVEQSNGAARGIRTPDPVVKNDGF